MNVTDRASTMRDDSMTNIDLVSEPTIMQSQQQVFTATENTVKYASAKAKIEQYILS